MASNTKTSEIKLTKILHYGAQITFSLVDESNGRGFICGDGFITKTISYKKEAAFETEDFAGAIFKVFQPFSHTAQKFLEEELLNQGNEGKQNYFMYFFINHLNKENLFVLEIIYRTSWMKRN